MRCTSCTTDGGHRKSKRVGSGWPVHVRSCNRDRNHRSGHDYDRVENGNQ